MKFLKALPILYYAIVISDKRERLFTASMATGIGFAVLENAYYLLNYPNFTMLSAVIRAFGSGLMHGMCTLLVGMGISFVKKKSKLFAVGTFGLLSTAIVYHGIYNILIQSEYSIVGALLPIATYIPFFTDEMIPSGSALPLSIYVARIRGIGLYLKFSRLPFPVGATPYQLALILS